MKAVRRQNAGSAEDGPDRSIRADARRNHDALLQAAGVVFATSGVDAPVKEIAELAGVGIGTVYRRFPRRTDLIVAVFRREIDDCVQDAEALAADHPPFEALSRWIQRYLDLILTKRGLATALHSGEPAYETLADYFETQLVAPLTRLLEAAKSDIQVDVSPAELLRAVALLRAPGVSGDVGPTRRMAALLINGLTVPARPHQRRPALKRKAEVAETGF